MANMPRSIKEARSFGRIQRAALRKNTRKVRFYQKLAERKGLKLEGASCQLEVVHVVDSVVPAGHGWFYSSRVCGGCQAGIAWFGENAVRNRTSGQYYKLKGDPPTEIPKMCPAGLTSVLFSAKEIVPGEIVFAKGLLDVGSK